MIHSEAPPETFCAALMLAAPLQQRFFHALERTAYYRGTDDVVSRGLFLYIVNVGVIGDCYQVCIQQIYASTRVDTQMNIYRVYGKGLRLHVSTVTAYR